MLPICPLADLPRGEALRVPADPPIAVFHTEDGEVLAIDDTCTHQDASLADGRPPLSKELLAGRMTPADLALEAEDEDLGVDWRLGVRAEALDAAERAVRLSDGTVLRSDGVVLATGARARTLPVAAGVAGVH